MICETRFLDEKMGQAFSNPEWKFSEVKTSEKQQILQNSKISKRQVPSHAKLKVYEVPIRAAWRIRQFFLHTVWLVSFYASFTLHAKALKFIPKMWNLFPQNVTISIWGNKTPQ